MARSMGGMYVRAVLGSVGATGVYGHAEALFPNAWTHYYAGTFWVDTGYDDPVQYDSGVEGAEVYGARVYPVAGSHYPGVGANNLAGIWRVSATPVWGAQFRELPATTQSSRRVWLRCDAYLSNPPSTTSGAWYILNEIAWSLYRI